MNFKKIIRILLVILIVVVIVDGIKIVKYFYPLNYTGSIIKYSEKYDLDPYFVAAVINTESHFNTYAKSHKNAYGLMQITLSTGQWVAQKMSIKDYTQDMLYDPDINIKMGCWYLSDLKIEFKDNIELVLAAYNAGRGNVRKWLKDEEKSKNGEELYYIPFGETDKYIKKVKVNYNVYKFLYKDLKRSK